MKKDINNLIFAIRNAIKDYSEGSLSPQEAKTEYEKLLHRYHQLRQGEKSEHGSGFIKGVCYHHNIENFSIFSGLYMLSENEFDLMFYYGDEKINLKIIDTLNNNQKRIEKSEFSTILPEENSSLSQTLYLYPILNSFNYHIFFIALSSSEYFSLEKFVFIGAFFSEIFNSSLLKQNPINLNYYENTIHKIVDFLSENINETYSVAVHLFSLKLVKNIFFHMGTFSLLEITDGVIDKLQRNFPDNAHVFALSLNEYIVLTPLMRKSKQNPLKGKLEFDYKGISIQHKILQRRIDSTDSIFRLLSEINQVKYDSLNGNRKR